MTCSRACRVRHQSLREALRQTETQTNADMDTDTHMHTHPPTHTHTDTNTGTGTGTDTDARMCKTVGAVCGVVGRGHWAAVDPNGWDGSVCGREMTTDKERVPLHGTPAGQSMCGATCRALEGTLAGIMTCCGLVCTQVGVVGSLWQGHVQSLASSIAHHALKVVCCTSKARANATLPLLASVRAPQRMHACVHIFTRRYRVATRGTGVVGCWFAHSSALYLAL